MKLEPPKLPVPELQIKTMIIENLLAELRINLYHDLKKILGDRLGKEVHKQLYIMSSDRSVQNYLGKKPPVETIVMHELTNFNMVGFQLEGYREIEDGEEVFYEHFSRCPFNDYTKKKGIEEMPCDITCKYDSENAMKNEIGRWECLQRLADGADKCIFRIRSFKHYDKEEDIKKIVFDRTRLNSKYTERFRDDY